MSATEENSSQNNKILKAQETQAEVHLDATEAFCDDLLSEDAVGDQFF